MSPNTGKFNEEVRRRINKINKSQAIFLSKARKLDELTGENYSADIQKSFNEIKSDKMFNPANFE